MCVRRVRHDPRRDSYIHVYSPRVPRGAARWRAQGPRRYGPGVALGKNRRLRTHPRRAEERAPPPPSPPRDDARARSLSLKDVVVCALNASRQGRNLFSSTDGGASASHCENSAETWDTRGDPMSRMLWNERPEPTCNNRRSLGYTIEGDRLSVCRLPKRTYSFLLSDDVIGLFLPLERERERERDPLSHGSLALAS